MVVTAGPVPEDANRAGPGTDGGYQQKTSKQGILTPQLCGVINRLGSEAGLPRFKEGSVKITGRADADGLFLKELTYDAIEYTKTLQAFALNAAGSEDESAHVSRSLQSGRLYKEAIKTLEIEKVTRKTDEDEEDYKDRRAMARTNHTNRMNREETRASRINEAVEKGVWNCGVTLLKSLSPMLKTHLESDPKWTRLSRDSDTLGMIAMIKEALLQADAKAAEEIEVEVLSDVMARKRDPATETIHAFRQKVHARATEAADYGVGPFSVSSAEMYCTDRNISVPEEDDWQLAQITARQHGPTLGSTDL